MSSLRSFKEARIQNFDLYSTQLIPHTFNNFSFQFQCDILRGDKFEENWEIEYPIVLYDILYEIKNYTEIGKKHFNFKKS